MRSPMPRNIILTVLFPVCLLFGASFSTNAAHFLEESSENVETLNVNYLNQYYISANLPATNIRILKVNNLRETGFEEIKTVIAGIHGDDKPLVLSEPVNTFVKRSFATMIPRGEESAKKINIVLNIEEFWAGYNKTSLIDKHIDFNARIGISIIRQEDTVTVKAGYLKHRYAIDIASGVKEGQAHLIYQGMVAMAQQLARDFSMEKIVLDSELEPESDLVEEPELHLSTPVLGYESKKHTGCTFETLVFTGALMSDTYSAMPRFRFYTGVWGKNRTGYQLSSECIIATGYPQRVNPHWDVSSSEIKMYGLTLGGSILYSLRKKPREVIFNPYLGLGVRWNLGLENISGEATRMDGFMQQGFSGNVWSLRMSVAADVSLASRVKVTDKYYFGLCT